MARAANSTKDWLFSGPVKRKLLAAVLSRAGETVREVDLAADIGACKRGSLPRHLQALVSLGLIAPAGTRTYRIKSRRELDVPQLQLAEALEEVFDALEGFPDDPPP